MLLIDKNTQEQMVASLGSDKIICPVTVNTVLLPRELTSQSALCICSENWAEIGPCLDLTAKHTTSYWSTSPLYMVKLTPDIFQLSPWSSKQEFFRDCLMRCIG